MSSFGSRWTVCKLTCGNCRGRSSSLSKIMQIVTSTVRVKQLCEMRYSATILSVTELVTSLAEKVTMNNFDGTNAPRNDSGAPPVASILGVALPVNARGDDHSVASACGENGRRQTATVWCIRDRMSRIGRGGFEQATNGFTSLQIRSSQPCTQRARTGGTSVTTLLKRSPPTGRLCSLS